MHVFEREKKKKTKSKLSFIPPSLLPKLRLNNSIHLT